jgi:5-enolpyruvylshikimate-3-phosphate synthase
MALPLLKGDSTILVDNLKSKPYIDMTLSIMHHFGVEVENENYKVFRVKGHQQYKAARYNIEGDWSGAAFFLVLGAVKGGVEVMNLNTKSSQADRQIVSALEKAGAEVKRSSNAVIVEKKSSMPSSLMPPIALISFLLWHVWLPGAKEPVLLKEYRDLLTRRAIARKRSNRSLKKWG